MIWSQARVTRGLLGYTSVAVLAVAGSTVALGAAAADSPTAQNTQLIAIHTEFPDPVAGPTTCDVTIVARSTVLGPAAPHCPDDAAPSGSVAYTVPYTGTRALVTYRLRAKWAPFSDAQGPTGQGWLRRSNVCLGEQVQKFVTPNDSCTFVIRHVDRSLRVPAGYVHQSGPPIAKRPPRYVLIVTDTSFGADNHSPCDDTVSVEGLVLSFPECALPDPPTSVHSISVGLPNLAGLAPPAGHVNGFTLSIASPDPDSAYTYSVCAPPATEFGGVGTSSSIGIGATNVDLLSCQITHYHSANGLNGSATSP